MKHLFLLELNNENTKTYFHHILLQIKKIIQKTEHIL